MYNTIGIIAQSIEIKSMIVDLFPEEVKKGKIIIDLLDEDIIEQQGIILEKKGAKAIIGRSGGYIHTLSTVDVPVINLEVTTIDILRAIKKAKTYHKQIVLVLSDVDYFDYEEWKDIISPSLTIERFNHKKQICNKVKKYIDKKDEVVIVGGGIPCRYAENFNIDSVFITASIESIREGVKYANQLLSDLYTQKYNKEILENTLDVVHDSVIAIDKTGKILLFNKKAQEMFQKNYNDIIGRDLNKVFPELNFIFQVNEKTPKIKNRIVKIKEHTIMANVTMINVENMNEGYLCTFQDITKLQELEKKIRVKLNKKGLVAKYKFEDIIAHSPKMSLTIEKAKKIANYDNTTMIYGESGTGKEMFAQSIHNMSERKDSPFVAINCAALTESLLESELFGYEHGSFTGARKDGKSGLFELAHGGTIFLDEINSISLNLQSKLLRVLEEKEIMRIGSDYVIPLDVRIISAANEKLNDKIDDGTFRKDLFYRLNTLQLKIPPLRERPEDIMPIFMYYLKENKCNDILEELQIEKLNSYSWPGNVRELKNVLERYLIFKELIFDVEEEKISYLDSREININLKEINRLVETNIISMLENSGMNKTEIAKTLGISRTALWKKNTN